ncbi:MAG: exodeoxyribonuclease VII large subunit [Limnochordales bacterium]
MAASEPQIYSVRELTAMVKERLTSDPRLAGVAVLGEISNFKHHSSGHMYFTLKDEHSRLRCVMFRRENMRLRFRPADGQAVIAKGDVSVYEAAGDYQLYVREMVPAGHGELALAFEQLKQKLAAEGLFDEERKRPLPVLPRRIGVVTSPEGAALRDIISVTRRRFPNMPILLAPAVVQGEEGPDSVVRAIRLMNEHGGVDVLIVGRGGGSLEDLWTFNDERVARAIAASRIPVISAVGHETDFTIADFVADKRAPTPSAAAEMAVPDKRALLAHIQGQYERLQSGVRRRIEQGRARLRLLESRPVLARPGELLLEYRQRVDDAEERAGRAARDMLDQRERALAAAAGKLDALSPVATLARGYAVARRADTGQVVRRGGQVAAGDELLIRVVDAELTASVKAVAPAPELAADAAGG